MEADILSTYGIGLSAIALVAFLLVRPFWKGDPHEKPMMIHLLLPVIAIMVVSLYVKLTGDGKGLAAIAVLPALTLVSASVFIWKYKKHETPKVFLYLFPAMSLILAISGVGAYYKVF